MNIKNNIASLGSAIYNDGNTGYIRKSRIVDNNIFLLKFFDAEDNWWGINQVSTIKSNA